MEKLIIDNTFLSNWFSTNSVGLAKNDVNEAKLSSRLNKYINSLKTNYDLQITDMVVNEAADYGQESFRQNVMKGLKTVDGKFAGISISNTQTYQDVVVNGTKPRANAGDYSIAEFSTASIRHSRFFEQSKKKKGNLKQMTCFFKIPFPSFHSVGNDETLQIPANDNHIKVKNVA